MSQITYHQATKEDFEDLYRMTVDFSNDAVKVSHEHETFFKGDWQKYFKEEIQESLDDKDEIYYIAKDGEEAVGYIKSYYCKKCYYYIIDEFYVREDYRNKKIGQALFDLAIEWGQKFDCPMRVEVFNWNQKAVNFYVRNKFRPTTIILELE